MTTTHPPESSVWTAKGPPSCSTVSCTRCATIALARSTPKPVSIYLFSYLQYLLCLMFFQLTSWRPLLMILPYVLSCWEKINIYRIDMLWICVINILLSLSVILLNIMIILVFNILFEYFIVLLITIVLFSNFHIDQYFISLF